MVIGDYFTTMGVYELLAIFMTAIVLIWVGFQIFSYRKDVGVIKKIRGNSKEYGKKILQLIDDSKIMENQSVDIKTINQLIDLLKMFPQHKIIKRLRKRFNYAKDFAEKEQYVLSDRALHFDYVTLPIISGIVSLFALLNKKVEGYLRTNLKNARIEPTQADTKVFEILSDVIKMFKTNTFGQ